MSSSVTAQLVERRLELVDADHRAEDMSQSTEDFFTRDDRKELYRQTVLAEQNSRDLAEIKAANKEAAATAMEAREVHEKRIRVLEDDRLILRTELAISWKWIVLIAGGASAGVSWLMRLIWK
jgi:hypothetical protein